jgi:lipopolysaccharide heptosyltransferase II
MNIDRMRNLDRYLGTPLCWIMGGLQPFLRRRERAEVKNILVIKYFGLGSILLSTPALELIRGAYPSARITYLSFTSNKELLQRIPFIDDILTLDASGMLSMTLGLPKVLSRLRSARYDIVFDLEFFAKFSTLLSVWTGAPRRVGFELPTLWRKMLVTHHVPLTKKKHVVNAFCDQIEAVAGKQTHIPSVGAPTTKDADAKALHEKLPPEHAPFFCVNANAADTFLERRWQPEKYSEFIKDTARRSPYLFYFTGTQEERPYVQHIIDMLDAEMRSRCHNLAGMLTIPEFMQLLRESACLISGDSGPVHLAAAFGIPVVALYGPETPDFYGPVGTRTSTIYKAIECSPCMNIYDAKAFRCPYNARCMQEIQVEDVMHAVEQLGVLD